VVECKTSVRDFYADKRKRFAWRHKEHGWIIYKLWTEQKENFEKIEVSMMGDFRFYFCEPGIITTNMVEEHAPDHGLIYKDGRAMRIVRPAPRRTLVDKDGEIRYLRFAIINGKVPHGVVPIGKV